MEYIGYAIILISASILLVGALITFVRTLNSAIKDIKKSNYNKSLE